MAVSDPVRAGDRTRAARLEIRVLGPLEIAWDGRADRPRRRQGAGAGRPPARSTAASSCRSTGWSTRCGVTTTATGAEIALRSTISRLRKRLREAGAPEDLIVTRAPGYALDVAAEMTDVSTFEKMVAEGRQQLARRRPSEAMRLLVGGAGALARLGLQRGAGRAVRPGRGAPARGAAARGDRDPHRCRPDVGPARGAHRRAGDADERQPDARAPVVAAHAGALPLRPAGRGAARVPGPALDPGGRAGHRAGPRRLVDGARHPRPGPGARLPRAARARRRGAAPRTRPATPTAPTGTGCASRRPARGAARRA